MNKKNKRNQTSLNLFKLVCSLLNQKEKGFGAFAGLCVGLIIMFVCTALIVKSQEHKLSSSAQVMKANSKMAAETAAHNYLAFISKYPSIMELNDCEGSRDVTGKCENDSDLSWANPPMNDYKLEEVCDLDDAAPDSKNAEKIKAKFETVTKETIGDDLYKFVSYTYDASTTTGTLTLDGFSAMDEATGEVEQTKHRLEIQIEIEDRNPPGLWAHSFGPRIHSKIGAHVTDSSDCTDSLNDYLGYEAGGNYKDPSELSLDPDDSDGEKGSVNPRMRPFPRLPNNGVYALPADILSIHINDKLDIIDGPLKLPQDQDVTTEGDVFDSGDPGKTSGSTFIYHLKGDGIHSIDLYDEKLTLGETGEETIKIYADQLIKLDGDSTIELVDDGDSDTPNFTKAIFFANSHLRLRGQDSSKHKTTDFQVYVYGNKRITIEGNREFKAFLFAPESSIFLMGDTPPNGNLASGAIWVKQYVPDQKKEVNNFHQMLTKDDMQDLEISAEYNQVKDLEIERIRSWKQIAWE
jgi:hypothetical protein